PAKVPSADALLDLTNRATATYDERIGLLEAIGDVLAEEQAQLRIATAEAPGGLRCDQAELRGEFVGLAARVALVEHLVERVIELQEAGATPTRRGRRRWAKLQTAREQTSSKQDGP